MTTPRDGAATPVDDASAIRPSFASRRLSFGANADAYARFRPGYNDRIVDWLLGHPTPGRSLEVLDLATGTGRLARDIAEAGYAVVAVEPDADMRARAIDALGPERVLAGSAEAIPLPDESVDVVTVGTAWHWFDPATAPVEIARVLRPNGLLSVVWNLRDDRVPWVAAFDEIIDGQDRVLRPTEVRFSAPPGHFSPPDFTQIPHEVSMAPADLVGLASSFSYVTLRPDADAVLQRLRILVDTHPDLVGRDTVALPYVAHCYRSQKLQ